MQPTRRFFISAGSSFLTQRAKFAELVDNFIKLAEPIPSLEFSDRSDGCIHFVLLGTLYRIQHRFYFDKKWVGVIESMYKASQEDEHYVDKFRLIMDERGNIQVPNGAWPWEAPRDYEPVFFYLITGKIAPDF